MSLISVAKGVWEKASTTSNGRVFHKNGVGPIYYVVSKESPIGFDTQTQVSRVTQLSEDFAYSDIDAGSFLWAYCDRDDALLVVTENIIDGVSTSSFGETITASKEPLIQLTATHGITDKLLNIQVDGAVTSTENSMFKVESGLNAGAIGAILSEREITAKSGQSIEAIFSTVFSSPIIGNAQQAGLITSETTFAFEYDNNGEFGIAHTFDGALEIQDLLITTAAGNETATIVIDGISYNVPLTNSTINQNAYEIATYLNENDSRYNATSNNDTVTFLAVIPDVGAGVFSFSSAAAVASFTEIATGSLGTSNNIKKSDWNVRPDFDVDPQMGNTYKIQYAFTGFDNIEFYINNSESGKLELVHIIKYGNRHIKPSASNPIFRIGWATRNTTNIASSVSLFGGSAAASNIGLRVYDANPRGVEGSQDISPANQDINILTVRSRRVLGEYANRSDSLVLNLGLTTESTKITSFKLIKDPVAVGGGFLDFQYIDGDNSFLEVAKNKVQIVDGTTIGTYDTIVEKDVNIKELLDHLSAGETIAITANVKSGGTADCSASLNYKDDI